MEMGTCATCAFFHDGVHPTECRFDPPFPYERDGVARSRWPRVDYKDWCGRYRDGRRNGQRKTFNILVNEGEVKE